MPNSPKAILDRMVHKGAMTAEERDKIMRNLIRVRCKDCKYRTIESAIGNGALVCQFWKNYTSDDMYCSVVERREDE